MAVSVFGKNLRIEATIPEGMSNEDFDTNMEAAQEKLNSIISWAQDRLQNRLQHDQVLGQYNMTVTLSE